MQKIYESLDNFKIETCNVKATVRSCFELVKYDIQFSIEKINEGPNTWEIISPINGFSFLYAKDSNGNDISKRTTETINGLKKITLDLTDYITSTNKAALKIGYENRLQSEVINNKFFSKEYGIIFTRSFGSYCQYYLLEVIIENKWFSFKDTIPKFSYPKRKSFEFTTIPSQKPISVAITSYLRIKRIGIILMFILTALAGNYIPKIMDWLLRKVG